MRALLERASVRIDTGVGGAIDYCYEQGWTDGLPVVPPEPARVEAMLSMEGRGPETIIASHATTGRECSVLAAAVNAVMAGCRPDYFPVVVAALEAMNEHDYHFYASAASTGGAAPLLVVSGPVVEDIGMNAAGNVFGPGNRANATIGRAIRLVIMNVFEIVPGLSDLSTQGHPGKYSFCIAERADRNPWTPLNEELGYPPEVSSVTVFAGAGLCNVENHRGNTPEQVLDCFADAMANLGCISSGQAAIVMSPEHARVVSSRGWTKKDVRRYLFEQARRPVPDVERVGKLIDAGGECPEASTGLDAHRVVDEHVHRGRDANDILITVAGGDAGAHSAFIPSWSQGRWSIMQSKPIGVCLDCN